MFIGLLNVCAIRSFGKSLVSNSKGPLKCLTLNNQPCQARPMVVNINSDETLFYPFTAYVNKCSGSCNKIDDPYAQVCVPDKVKNINVKAFNVRSKCNKIFSST